MDTTDYVCRSEQKRNSELTSNAPSGEVLSIDKEVSRLNEQIDYLAERLSPVLRTARPVEDVCEPMPEGSYLMQVRLRLSAQIGRLIVLQDRIDA